MAFERMIFGFYCDGSKPDSHLHKLCLTEVQAFDYAFALRGSRTLWGGLSYLIGPTWLEHDEESIDGSGGRIMGEITWLPFPEREDVPMHPPYPARKQGAIHE